uniref:sister chromatid cohesion protein PDS5 homolog A-like n=1 Tax=Myxine glutinosa TaxID=7769 RepID=UPI0035902F62
MVKFLLERIAPVHIDAEAVSALIKQINKSIDGTADDEDEGVSSDTAIRAGLELLKVLSFTNPAVFHSAETFESLLHCLKMEDEKVSEAALQIFRNTGQRIETDFPQIRSALIPVLQQKAKKGTPQQAKHAVHCIYTIFSNRDTQFAQIFEPLSKSLDANNPEQLIAPLVSIGHMAILAPEQFAGPMKAMVANFIVKDLLMNDRRRWRRRGGGCVLTPARLAPLTTRSTGLPRRGWLSAPPQGRSLVTPRTQSEGRTDSIWGGASEPRACHSPPDIRGDLPEVRRDAPPAGERGTCER